MTSVEAFKSAVVRIRDILRGPGMSITGMDSMRHICLYLMSRYITREKAPMLGVPDVLCWESFMDMIRKQEGGRQFALNRFYHADIEDCLIYHFDRMFGTEKFSFDVKNITKHAEILEILDKVNLSDVDCHMDILGWVYEQHLKTGASSASRDLGQFFTDRSICEYMVQLCAPGFRSPGVPESVCDPSMGTGGFLSSYVKYFKNHHADMPVDWKVQEKEIHGCDTDPKVAGMARLNLFMELGGHRASQMKTHDSLYGDLTLTGYDLILANMPFGLKGLKHAECCERVKALKIRGTKSEPLFLQLMMVSLNRGGRCAVVVPDGMLVNQSECHDGTRRYLLDHFELKRVIKMQGKFFMNTGIQPSILFFENTGHPTTAVEFWDAERRADGTVKETMHLSVPRESFDASCSLDMRRYQEVKEMAHSLGYPMVRLEDIAIHENGKTLSSSEKLDNGEYDVMGGGMSYIGKTNKYNREGNTISISKSGASAGFVAFHSKKYWAGDCLTIVPNSESCDIHYLYYYMKLNSHLTTSTASGSTIPHCKWDDIKGIQLVLPPLSIQQEIVATLDRIYQPGTTELAETLTLTNQALESMIAEPNGTTLEPILEAQRLIRKSVQMVADIKEQMVADVKTQMVAIVKSVGSRGFVMAKLGDICRDISTNKNIPSSERKDGAFRFFTCSRDYSTHNECHYDGTYIIHGSRGSTISESVFVTNNEKFSIGTSMFISAVMDNTKADINYIYFNLKYNREIVDTLVNSSAIPMISKTSYYTIEIPLPPLEFQQALVARLQALQSQLTALERLDQQAEENARFILESYLGSSSTSSGKQEAAWTASVVETIEPVEPTVAALPAPYAPKKKRSVPSK